MSENITIELKKSFTERTGDITIHVFSIILNGKELKSIWVTVDHYKGDITSTLSYNMGKPRYPYLVKPLIRTKGDLRHFKKKFAEDKENIIKRVIDLANEEIPGIKKEVIEVPDYKFPKQGIKHPLPNIRISYGNDEV